MSFTNWLIPTTLAMASLGFSLVLWLRMRLEGSRQTATHTAWRRRMEEQERVLVEEWGHRAELEARARRLERRLSEQAQAIETLARASLESDVDLRADLDAFAEGLRQARSCHDTILERIERIEQQKRAPLHPPIEKPPSAVVQRATVLPLQPRLQTKR